MCYWKLFFSLIWVSFSYIITGCVLLGLPTYSNGSKTQTSCLLQLLFNQSTDVFDLKMLILLVYLLSLSCWIGHVLCFAVATDGPDNVTIFGPVSVHAGDLTMFYCSAMSVPSAHFTWLLNEKPTNGHEAVFIIQSSRSSDSGRYSCSVVNTATGRSQTVNHELTVVGRCKKLIDNRTMTF